MLTWFDDVTLKLYLFQTGDVLFAVVFLIICYLFFGLFIVVLYPFYFSFPFVLYP